MESAHSWDLRRHRNGTFKRCGRDIRVVENRGYRKETYVSIGGDMGDTPHRHRVGHRREFRVDITGGVGT